MKYNYIYFNNPLISKIAMIIGILLLSINIYGLFQDVRPQSFPSEDLRFQNDISLSREQTFDQIRRLDENSIDYAKKVTKVIADGIAHIHWNKFEPTKYNQTIPIWENYFLFFMAKFSGIPEFERYHHANYIRSLNRGIGLCGDASMIMSQVLEENNIENKIVSFKEHVVVSAMFDNKEMVFDPDFGVVLPFSVDEINRSPNIVEDIYLQNGFNKNEIRVLTKTYAQSYGLWDGVSHFITKKYYFEKFAYAMKWPLPIALILIALIVRYKYSRKKAKELS